MANLDELRSDYHRLTPSCPVRSKRLSCAAEVLNTRFPGSTVTITPGVGAEDGTVEAVADGITICFTAEDEGWTWGPVFQ